jgi:hypothetical protein
MKLYIVHCGFYDPEFLNGVFEFHVDLPIVATSLDEAKVKVRATHTFQAKQMHIDGIHELKSVSGYEIIPVPLSSSLTDSDVTAHPYRDL